VAKQASGWVWQTLTLSLQGTSETNPGGKMPLPHLLLSECPGRDRPERGGPTGTFTQS
jgi:hypothetical protein